MKMKACRATIRMWKIAHTVPATMWPRNSRGPVRPPAVLPPPVAMPPPLADIAICLDRDEHKAAADFARDLAQRIAPLADALQAEMIALPALTQTLLETAEALRYAEVVAATVPELQAVFGGQAPQGETLDQLRRLRRVGEIFRFKLFDRDGRQVLVSDDLDRAAPVAAAGPSIAEHQGARNQNVQDIVLGGRNFIERKSGAGKADRPPWYSEAYVPVLRDGRDQRRGIEPVQHHVARAAQEAREQIDTGGMGQRPDMQHRVVDRERSGNAGRRHLPHAVTEHRGGADAP